MKKDDCSARWVHKTQTFNYSQLPVDLHVTTNFNADFCFPAGVMITSLFENNSDINVMIHIFTDSMSPEDLLLLEKTAKYYQRTITIYFLNMALFQGFHIHHHHYNRVAYARLCMPEVLAKVAARYLYVDADTLIVGSLASVITLDLAGKSVGGVTERADYVKEMTAFLKMRYDEFINAGVMLVDVPLWLKKGYTHKAFSYQGRSPKTFGGHDQDIVNMTCDGDIALIDSRYNDFSGRRWMQKQDSVIIHFLGRIKPWKIALTDSPTLSIWQHYAALSAWGKPITQLPEKLPKNYYYFSHAARYYCKHRQWLRALQCYRWYIVLKVACRLNKR